MITISVKTTIKLMIQHVANRVFTSFQVSVENARAGGSIVELMDVLFNDIQGRVIMPE